MDARAREQRRHAVAGAALAERTSSTTGPAAAPPVRDETVNASSSYGTKALALASVDVDAGLHGAICHPTSANLPACLPVEHARTSTGDIDDRDVVAERHPHRVRPHLVCSHWRAAAQPRRERPITDRPAAYRSLTLFTASRSTSMLQCESCIALDTSRVYGSIGGV